MMKGKEVMRHRKEDCDPNHIVTDVLGSSEVLSNMCQGFTGLRSEVTNSSKKGSGPEEEETEKEEEEVGRQMLVCE